jgi:hypothetical protein
MASEWMCSLGLEVVRIIDDDYYHKYDSQDISQFSDKELATVGLVPKYPLPIKPKWWQFIL